MDQTRILERLRMLRFKREEREERDGASSTVAAPYVRALATLEYTIRLQRRVGLVVGLAGLGLLVYQQSLVYQLSADLREQDFLVVPGAVDFVRVRPNLIGDKVILSFARFFTERMVSVGHRTMGARYQEMSRYMSPALWANMQRSLDGSEELFKAGRITEVASLGTVEAERRELADGEAGFVATLKVSVDRYAGDRVLEQRLEYVTMEFRTSALSADDPWLFEVVEFARRSPDEHRQYKRAIRGTVE